MQTSSSITVLCVDDEPAIRRAVTRTLERSNIDVRVASSGMEALHIAADIDFPVIVTDLRMPGLDGRHLIERLHRLQPNAQFVLVSGVAEAESEPICQRFGYVAEALCKPWDPNDLVRAVLAAADSGQRARRPVLGTNLLGQELGSLLLVEDNTGDAVLVRAALQASRSDRNIVWVPTLAEALEALEARAFETVVCDLCLPDADELTTLAALVTQSPESAVVVLSGNQSRELADRAIQLGAQDFLVKGQHTLDTLDRAVDNAIQRKQTEQRLRYLTRHDALTGLETQSNFRMRFTKALERAETTKTSLSLVTVHIDGMRQIWGTLGAEVGDGLLVGLADRIGTLCDSEIFAARVSNNEFAVLVEQSSDERVEGFVKLLFESVEEPQHIGRHHVCPTLSAGCATYPRDAETGKALFKCSDTAMRTAQEAPGNSFYQFDTTSREPMQDNLPTEEDLTLVLARDEFVLHYQPQYSLADGRLTGFEALIRWQRSDGKTVPPGMFIDTLEESTLIHEVGQWVIRTACEQLKAWRDKGDRDLRMSVNVAPSQLDRRGLAETVQATLTDLDLPPDALQLELTERVVMRDESKVNEVLLELAKTGVRFAIDDFGTGFASLAYLQRLKVHTIKIDRSFVEGVDENPQALSLLSAIVSLGRQLDISLTVEGIETAGQLAAVQTTGAHDAQGYFLHRPASQDRADNPEAHSEAAQHIASAQQREADNDESPTMLKQAG